MNQSFKLIFDYFKRYKSLFIIGIIGLLAVDGFQIFIPWMIKSSIDVLTESPENYRSIIKYGIGILLLATGVGISRFMWRYYIIGISRRIETHLRNRFYGHLQKLSFNYFDQTSVGDLMAHATNDLEAVRMMCGMAIVASMDAGLLMIASLVMMLTIDVSLTAYVLIPMPIVTLIVLRLGPIMHARFMQVQVRFSEISEKAQETFSGIRVVKSFVQETKESSNFSEINQEYLKDNMRLVRVWGMMHPLIWTIGGVCGVIILMVGGNRVIDGKMSMGGFVAFNSYMGTLMWPMIAIGWVVNMYQRGKASLGRIRKILDLEPEITNTPGAKHVDLSGQVEFRNLTFRYGKAEPVLKNINLTIKPAQWVVIMGPTGSSKTTLINLISRLYEPPENTVFLDNIDARNIRLESLREQVCFVPQQTFLFSDTLINNIRFGRDLPDETVCELANKANVYNDIMHFPDKFETMVGEKGVTLSGGQKQRIAIARALAVQSPILIMDDALSAVDTETEETIIKNIQELTLRQTVILITHRVSTAREADLIVFLEDGEIVERGSHHELIQQQGRYFEVYEHQRLEEELEQTYNIATPGAGEGCIDE